MLDISSESLAGVAAVREGTAQPGRRRRSYSPERMRAMESATLLAGRAFDGDPRASLELREALSTSDFQGVFADVLDRELLQQYQQMSPVWPAFARRASVRDFKPKKFYDLLGGRGVLERVPELTEYPARSVDTNDYALQVGKFGGRIGISWEAMVDDDLDMFRDLPQRLAQGATDTEDVEATSLIASATGPNSAFFTSGNGNLLAGNPVLSTDSLTDAITAISERKDSEGRPIVAVSSLVLVIPQSLLVPAQNILNATEIRQTNSTTGQTVITNNWLAQSVSIVVNPWLSVVDTSANSAKTWYLLPAPSIARPAAAMAFLRGYETPDLRVKADTGTRVGGGAVGAEEGSFDADDIQYRVRHVLGGATLDPIATMVSTGAGS